MPRTRPGLSSPMSRTAAQLNSTIEKNLLGYAALASAGAAGILALAQPAQDTIVYTPANQVIPVNATFSLDLNADGINDFNFIAFSAHSHVARTHSPFSYAGLLVEPVASSNQMVGNAIFPSALYAKAHISSNAKFVSARAGIMASARSVNGGVSYNGPWDPAGAGVKNRYLGLKFVINGQVHFGWARLSVKAKLPKRGGVKAVLTGYAYETVANKPIAAGKTTGPNAVVQPASLGDLATGAAGLTAWRRE